MTQLAPPTQNPPAAPDPIPNSKFLIPNSRGLVRILAAIVGAIAIFWLGYGVGRVQNIANLSRLYRDNDVDRYSFTRADVLVHFERLSGDGKPYIQSADGYEILDISDWDHNSVITVDGSTYELVRLYPTSTVDYERYRLAETLQGNGWMLEREVSEDPDGTVHIVNSFVARRPIQRVQLSLAHTHAVLANAKVEANQVTASVTRQTADQVVSGGSQAPAAYNVSDTAGSGGSLQFRAGDASPLGVASFIADMTASNPPVDQRVVLGEETVKVLGVR